jgi:hypothetical protein
MGPLGSLPVAVGEAILLWDGLLPPRSSRTRGSPGHDAYKGPPALGRHAVPWTSIETLRHVFPDGARQDPQTWLERQLVGNALLAPHEVVRWTSG